MSYVAERDPSGIAEGLFCLIPVIGWLSCLSGCSSADVPEPTMSLSDSGEVFTNFNADVDVIEGDPEIGAEGTWETAREASGEADTYQLEAGPDVVEDTGELQDSIMDVDEGLNIPELPSYETPIGAEETWQSKYESLGLCYNEFSTCKVVAASPCWFINEMNGSKPDTLAFLDPSLEKIELILDGGPLDGAEILDLIRVDEGVVMESGFLDSAVWMAGDVQVFADFFGETVDVLFSSIYADPEIGSCEYVYNYPCQSGGMCDTEGL